MALTGTYVPTSATESSGGGAYGVAWTNLANTKAEDNSRGTAALDTITGDPNDKSYRIDFTNFQNMGSGIDSEIGASDTIDEIRAFTQGLCTVANKLRVYMQLIVGGSLVGSEVQVSGTPGTSYGTGDTNLSIIDTPTNWGYAGLTAAEVRATNFGFSLRFENSHTAGVTVSQDGVWLIVGFTAAAGATQHQKINSTKLFSRKLFGKVG